MNLIVGRNTRDYNTRVTIKIKMKLKHQDTQGYYWGDVVWGGVGTANRDLLYHP